MKIIQSIENEKYVGLIIEKGPECIVNEGQLKRLMPYVSSLIANFAGHHGGSSPLKEKLKVVARSDTQAAFILDGVEDPSDLLASIQKICNKNLTEKIIVPQYMGDDEYIRHRVMEFEVANKQLIVKYVTIGEVNNFDAAMKEVASMYPEVK